MTKSPLTTRQTVPFGLRRARWCRWSRGRRREAPRPQPGGWSCRLAECPSELLVHDGETYLKTAYAEHYLGSGDAWGYAQPDLIVQPVVASWEECGE